MNEFFDCLNANRVFPQFEFKSVYQSPLNTRLVWLEGEFLKDFQDWKNWAMNQTDVPLHERKQYFLTDQTWEELQICVKSSVEVVRFSLSIVEVDHVVATKLNQDALEKFFGKLRQKRGGYVSFTCNEFSQSYASTVFVHTYAIKTVQRIKRTGDDLLPLEPTLQRPKVHRVH